MVFPALKKITSIGVGLIFPSLLTVLLMNAINVIIEKFLDFFFKGGGQFYKDNILLISVLILVFFFLSIWVFGKKAVYHFALNNAPFPKLSTHQTVAYYDYCKRVENKEELKKHEKQDFEDLEKLVFMNESFKEFLIYQKNNKPSPKEIFATIALSLLLLPYLLPTLKNSFSESLSKNRNTVSDSLNTDSSDFFFTPKENEPN